MRFKEVAARLTGVSTPFGGVSWTPPTLDRDVAVRTLAFLEDRRALYADFGGEDPGEVAASVLEIRRHLTEAIGSPGLAKELTDLLRRIRAACREYLDATRVREGFIPDDGTPSRCGPVHYTGLTRSSFEEALGRLRGTVGIYVGTLSARYQVDLEPGLASILPKPDMDA